MDWVKSYIDMFMIDPVQVPKYSTLDFHSPGSSPNITSPPAFTSSLTVPNKPPTLQKSCTNSELMESKPSGPSVSYSQMKFRDSESERNFLAGMVKGYERGLKLSRSRIISKTSVDDSIPEIKVSNVELSVQPESDLKLDIVQNVPELIVPSISVHPKTSATKIFGSAVKSADVELEHVDSDEAMPLPTIMIYDLTSRSSVDSSPILKPSKSYRRRLSDLLMNKRKEKQKEKQKERPRSKVHDKLINSPRFKINLSYVVEQKHRESLQLSQRMNRNSLTDMDPGTRLDILAAFHDDSFKKGLQEIILSVFKEQSDADQLNLPPPLGPPVAGRESLDLGEILAMSDDIKSMVDYWRTHSLSSQESKRESERDVSITDREIEVEGSESTGTMTTDNNLTESASEATIVTDTPSPSPRPSPRYTQAKLTDLATGQVVLSPRPPGAMKTFNIVCLTQPGIVVEPCWLYHKVVAIVPLSSVERDGRVEVGDVIFQIGDTSTRGMDRYSVRNLLAGYEKGRTLPITLLKAPGKSGQSKRLLTKRSIARFNSKSNFIANDEAEYEAMLHSSKLGP